MRARLPPEHVFAFHNIFFINSGQPKTIIVTQIQKALCLTIKSKFVQTVFDGGFPLGIGGDMCSLSGVKIVRIMSILLINRY